MNELTKNKIDDVVKTLNEQELRYLNRQVVERLKLISQAHSTVAMSNFSIGDKVSFTASDGSLIEGKIFKLNKKTVSIKTAEEVQWNVSPQLLQNAD
jgi:hypothetical protein